MPDGLETYNRKRDFRATPEPKGKVKRGKGQTYIIQKHDARRLHYDFRLELDGVLLSWAVTKGPSLDPSVKRLAVRTEDHPVDYAGFEGVIPSGYGAGTVMLWDRGSWTPKIDPKEGLKNGQLKFELDGERLKGGFALIRMKPKKGEKRENWLLIKERDEHASEATIATETWKVSVKSGRDLQDISTQGEDYAKGKTYKPKPRKTKGSAPPAFIAPQLATLKDAPPEGDGWLHEIKFDGYRIIAVINKGKAKLFTRNRKDWTHKYPSIAQAISDMRLETGVLDGELVALNAEGHADFSLMSEAPEDQSIPLVYYLFDALNLDGEDIASLPLIERKSRLQDVLENAPTSLKFSSHIEGAGDDVIASACKMNLEGVISKRADAPYRSGRTRSWIKSKCIGNDEFVVCGYRKSDKKGRPFSSLLLGEYVDEELVYRGRVGTGFDEATFKDLSSRFASRTRKTSPYAETPSEARQDAVWLRPDLVAQIAYLERTGDGRLRHPSFLGLRKDKEAEDVKSPRDEAEVAIRVGHGSRSAKPIAGVRLTSPEKVLWPEQGATKEQLARYLVDTADHILPYLKDRPVSLVRCPQGRSGKCFFQKHHNASAPDEIESVNITEKDGKSSPYLLVQSPTGLAACAQIGALELHIWGARIDMLENPERIVFDLDPDETLDFSEVRDAAFEMREVLQSMRLESFPLLTGGKGVHVIVPIVRRNSWTQVKSFSRGLAQKMEKAAPDRYIAQASKAKRKGRIFIDWLRNERGATAVTPYSTRARPGCPIATPVSWKELKTIETAAAFTIDTISQRLSCQRSDPWSDYAKHRQSLTQAMLDAIAS